MDTSPGTGAAGRAPRTVCTGVGYTHRPFHRRRLRRISSSVATTGGGPPGGVGARANRTSSGYRRSASVGLSTIQPSPTGIESRTARSLFRLAPTSWHAGWYPSLVARKTVHSRRRTLISAGAATLWPRTDTVAPAGIVVTLTRCLVPWKTSPQPL